MKTLSNITSQLDNEKDAFQVAFDERTEALVAMKNSLDAKSQALVEKKVCSHLVCLNVYT